MILPEGEHFLLETLCSHLNWNHRIFPLQTTPSSSSQSNGNLVPPVQL